MGCLWSMVLFKEGHNLTLYLAEVGQCRSKYTVLQTTDSTHSQSVTPYTNPLRDSFLLPWIGYNITGSGVERAAYGGHHPLLSLPWKWAELVQNIPEEQFSARQCWFHKIKIHDGSISISNFLKKNYQSFVLTLSFGLLWYNIRLIITEISNTHNLVAVGTFNYSDIYWNSNTVKRKMSNKFLEYIGDNFLIQKVKEVTGGTDILDLILTGRNWLWIWRLKAIWTKVMTNW